MLNVNTATDKGTNGKNHINLGEWKWDKDI